jgi:pyridoxal phosphate enzyme (YggS family)
LIGPLQRNKARHAARTFSVVHTIDRVETAVALARASEVRPIELLVQVNVMRDPAKGGIAPEALPALARDLARVDRVSMIGLMTIGREDASEKERRAAFAELRVLCEQLRSGGGEQMRELSMGMSDDYREAIAEGATMVRLGTAILGPRVGGWRGGERA